MWSLLSKVNRWEEKTMSIPEDPSRPEYSVLPGVESLFLTDLIVVLTRGSGSLWRDGVTDNLTVFPTWVRVYWSRDGPSRSGPGTQTSRRR